MPTGFFPDEYESLATRDLYSAGDVPADPEDQEDR